MEELKLIRMSAKQPEPVEWLWEPYIPRGAIILIQGDVCFSPNRDNRNSRSAKELTNIHDKKRNQLSRSGKFFERPEPPSRRR